MNTEQNTGIEEQNKKDAIHDYVHDALNMMMQMTYGDIGEHEYKKLFNEVGDNLKAINRLAE